MHRDAFSQNLRSIRIARGHRTMRSFAGWLDMNKNTYAKYERDGVRPLPATLDEICKRLGIAPEVLLETSPHSMSQ